MAMMLIALLAVVLPALQTETAQTGTMQSDVDRLVRAAEGLAGTWPSQPPPPVPEVAIVARHGKAVVPLLMALLSDDPHAERDRKRWKVQQQLTLTLSQIYSESQHCGRTYCDADQPERIGLVRAGWLNVIASDKEIHAASRAARPFQDGEGVLRQFEIGQALAAVNDRGAIAELETWLTHDDRRLRGNVAFVLGRLGDPRGFETIAAYLRIAPRAPLVRGSLVETGRSRRRSVRIATTLRICSAT